MNVASMTDTAISQGLTAGLLIDNPCEPATVALAMDPFPGISDLLLDRRHDAAPQQTAKEYRCVPGGERFLLACPPLTW